MPTKAPSLRPAEREKTSTRLTPLWRVLIHNDPVTTVDFVVKVLQDVWKIGFLAAAKIMLEAHTRGVALVVVETKEQAEFHIDKAHSMARARNYPLTFSMEPAE